jgi:NADH-quinone oxidoreductase subunit G
MPSLIIDDRAIEVPPGTKVIAAAERLGIVIPRLCYHPALGSVGACRLCAVQFLEGPVRGLQMGCMVEAKDGMVVSTTAAEAVDFRRHVIEWLMIHHPHDCPVCDEGGHCLLQDETVSGGHALRRYRGRKRTHRDQHLGPLVQHEMNRCIHCYRCRRFYQEFAGGRDLGALQNANRVYFGRFGDGTLESPFSGNLIDLCPTGVFTDRPARFKGRRWDFERAPSLCLHCSLGCNTVASARYREVVRLEGRLNGAVNGHFLCDRGRFGFAYANHAERPRRARIDGRETGIDEGLPVAAERLNRLMTESGPAAIALAASARTSLETQAMLSRLAAEHGFAGPASFPVRALADAVATAVGTHSGTEVVSLQEVAEADCILVVGADPVNEAPLLAFVLRQAWRRGAAVWVIDPRPVALPFPCQHLPLAPHALAAALLHLTAGAMPPQAAAGMSAAALRRVEARATLPLPPGVDEERWQAWRGQLAAARRPLIVYGTGLGDARLAALASSCAQALAQWKGSAGVFPVLPGANAWGAALWARGKASFEDALEGVEAGVVRALVAVECDPFHDFPDRLRLERALERLDLLVVLDYLPSPLAARAHVFLPTTPLFECDASFINQEGRLQRAGAVHRGGSPISQLTAGSHPPREFRSTVPAGEAQPAWQTLAQLAAALGGSEGSVPSLGAFRQWLVAQHPVLAGIEKETFPADGLRLPGCGVPPRGTSAEVFEADAAGISAGSLEVIGVEQTFGTEELSGYAAAIEGLGPPPRFLMHPGDAAALGLGSGERIVLELPGGPLEAPLELSPHVASGVVLLPRHRQLLWQRLGGWHCRLDRPRVRRAGP